MEYNTETLRTFAKKHPNNYTQLFHMALSNYVALIVQIPNVTNEDLIAASNDIGLTIDNHLRNSMKGDLIPNGQIHGFREISSRDATYGNYISALLYRQALLLTNNGDNIIGLNNNNKKIISLLQSAGDRPIMVEDSYRVMRDYTNDVIKYLRSRKNANLVQLHSFAIANHIIRLLG